MIPRQRNGPIRYHCRTGLAFGWRTGLPRHPELGQDLLLWVVVGRKSTLGGKRHSRDAGRGSRRLLEGRLRQVSGWVTILLLSGLRGR
jgi:hypothetical protein